MKTAIFIPDALFESAERLAKRLGISRSQLYQRAVESFLQQNSQQGVTEALDAIYGSEPEMSRLDPALEHLQSASVIKDEW